MRRLAFIVCLLTAVTALAQDEAPTIEEVAWIERPAGPASSSAHISPDGQRILHIQRDEFCVLTIEGEEEACAVGAEQTGLPRSEIEPDHDTVTWSPDGRTVAFTTQGLIKLTDTDIWVFDVDAVEFRNLTDEGYVGRLLSDETPEDVHLDLAPAWMPDGTLTFVRQIGGYRSPSVLMSIPAAGGLAMPVVALYAQLDTVATVMSLDWAPDGRTLAYTLYAGGSDRDAISGVWLYDAVRGDVSRLALSEDVRDPLRADFSPDGAQLLVITVEREQFTRDPERDGFFVVSIESSDAVRIDPAQIVVSAGWLPDGSLIYAGRSLPIEDSGLFVSSDPSSPGTRVMALAEFSAAPPNVFAPTPRMLRPLKIAANGLMLLGTPAQMFLVTRVSGAGAAPTPEAPTGDAPVTAARELARLPFRSGPLRTSAHLSPDGRTVMHVSANEFCLYTVEGAQQWCVEVSEAIEDRERPLTDIDPDSIVWSPDGRHLAFTTLALQNFRDSDIWVLDTATQAYTNLTDDAYGGAISFSDDVPDDIWVDLAPAWHPDGRLSFARHSYRLREMLPLLMIVDPDGGTPEVLAAVEGVEGAGTIVMSMDWADDGSQLAFVISSTSTAFGGLWLYDAVEADVRPVVIISEARRSYYVADFSPDGEHILVLSADREQALVDPGNPDAPSGYYIVKSGGGVPQPLRSDLFVSAAGWTPDSRIIYTAVDIVDYSDGGLYLTTTAGDPPVRLLDQPTIEDKPAPLYGPTTGRLAPLRVNDAGRLVLGTSLEMTLLVELSTP